MEGDGHGGGGVLDRVRRRQGGEAIEGDEELAGFLLLWDFDGLDLLALRGVQEDFAHVVGGPGEGMSRVLCFVLH